MINYSDENSFTPKKKLMSEEHKKTSIKFIDDKDIQELYFNFKGIPSKIENKSSKNVLNYKFKDKLSDNIGNKLEEKKIIHNEKYNNFIQNIPKVNENKRFKLIVKKKIKQHKSSNDVLVKTNKDFFSDNINNSDDFSSIIQDQSKYFSKKEITKCLNYKGNKIIKKLHGRLYNSSKNLLTKNIKFNSADKIQDIKNLVHHNSNVN